MGRLFKYLRFSDELAIIWLTMEQTLSNFGYYLMVYFFMLFGTGMATYLTFGPVDGDFKSLFVAARSMLRMQVCGIKNMNIYKITI